MTSIAVFANDQALSQVLNVGEQLPRTGSSSAPPVVLVIGLIGSTPPEADDRARFAQQAATTVPGVRDARITMSEPLRIDGQPGYETRIQATSGQDNHSVTVVK